MNDINNILSIILLFFSFTCLSMEQRFPTKRSYSIADILGEEYVSYEMNAVENTLLNSIIIPLLENDHDKIEQVLCGAYVIVSDDGRTYQEIAALPETYLRESSHFSEAPEFSIKLPILGSILTGIRIIDLKYATWFQLEASPQFKTLKKDPRVFDVHWARTMLQKKNDNELKYDNEGVLNPVTLFDWFQHDLWDFTRYVLSGMKWNFGPFGSSPHTEHFNPIYISEG